MKQAVSYSLKLAAAAATSSQWQRIRGQTIELVPILIDYAELLHLSDIAAATMRIEGYR